MAFTKYENRNFKPARLAMIEQANAICEEYAAEGLVLTLRQLFYQFVARDLIPNKQTEYDRLGELCRDARMAGLMDWDHLIDRTRNLQSFKTYDSPEAAMKEAADRYHRDLWAPQKQRLEVWIEKDAAIGVVEGVCRANSVPFFSCRGYTSMSEMHDAAQRLRWHMEQGNKVTVLHIGDHDPSGLDMSRDIEDRLRSFIHVDWKGINADTMPLVPSNPRGYTRGDFYDAMRTKMVEQGSTIGAPTKPWEVKRIALNVDQIERYSPPPNPAKQSDARFRSYMEATGLDQSWELDALEPRVMQDLIQHEIDRARDDAVWANEEMRMDNERAVITGISQRWDEVVNLIGGGR